MAKPVAFCLLFLPLVTAAQLHWDRVDTAYTPLPGSVHVYKSTDSLGGFPSVAYYLSARLKDKKLLFTAATGQGKRFTPSQYYQIEQSPLLVVNCTFFSFATNENYSLIVKDGRLISYNIISL